MSDNGKALFGLLLVLHFIALVGGLVAFIWAPSVVLIKALATALISLVVTITIGLFLDRDK